MSRNTTSRRTDWKSTLRLRSRKPYDTLAHIKNLSADAILNINFDDISGSIMETGNASTELNAEQYLALKCLIEKRRNKKKNINDFEIKGCKDKIDRYRQKKERDTAAANRITDMVMDQAGIDKFKNMNMPHEPMRKITNTATTRKGGRRTRIRRRVRKSHKRHKKRSTRRRL